jgi:F-type H+-transporting ATPase subunit epsilon
MTFHFEIITPAAVTFKDEVKEVVVPTKTGQIAILPNHVSLITQVVPGELIIRRNNSTEYLAVTGGFLQIHNNSVTLLSDYAVYSEEINIQKAVEAQKRAESLMKTAKEKSNDRDFARAETEFLRAIMEIKVAEKRKHRSRPQNPQ